MRNTTILFYRIKKINLCFFLLFFTKISFFHQGSSGVLQSSLFVAYTSVHVINSPIVWYPQASSSVLQPCRDTRHNPCDYKSNIRLHSFSCYLPPFKIEGRTLLYLFYTTIKKINLFFSLFIFLFFPLFIFCFFPFFLVC